MLGALAGYRTVIAMTLAFVVALWQYFLGPLPTVDPNAFAAAVAAVGVLLRLITTSPVGKKPE